MFLCVITVRKSQRNLTVALVRSDVAHGYFRGGGLFTCKNTHVRRTEKKV